TRAPGQHGHLRDDDHLARRASVAEVTQRIRHALKRIGAVDRRPDRSRRQQLGQQLEVATVLGCEQPYQLLRAEEGPEWGFERATSEPEHTSAAFAAHDYEGAILGEQRAALCNRATTGDIEYDIELAGDGI